jgi:hypothetical protein
MANPITPEQLASSGSEHGEQAAIFCWCSQNLITYPDLKWLYAVPNGGYRHPAEAGRLVAAGVKSGVPDICLPVRQKGWQGSNGLYIELKALKTKGKKVGEPRPEQAEWLAFLKTQGYYTAVCYGWIEARDLLIRYLFK